MTIKNKRAERRDTYRIKAEYSLISPDCGTIDCGPWINYTSDISLSGMGLYSHQPIRMGELVNIYLRQISQDPIRTRTVWCHRVMDDLYQIGLHYL